MEKPDDLELGFTVSESPDELIAHGLSRLDFSNKDAVITWLDELVPLLNSGQRIKESDRVRLAQKLDSLGYGDEEACDMIYGDIRENFIRPFLFSLVHDLPMPTMPHEGKTIAEELADKRERLAAIRERLLGDDWEPDPNW